MPPDEHPQTAAEDRGLWPFMVSATSDRAKVVATVAIDGAFVVVVALINFVASWGLARVHLDSVDLFVVRSLQWMFGIATLGVTLAFLVRDLAGAFFRGIRGGYG